MPRPLSQITRRVAPGLVLKPQRDSPNWQAHACVRGRVNRRSMGTSDVKIAQQRALKWFAELQNNPAAKPSAVISWQVLADRYLQTLPDISHLFLLNLLTSGR
jgi:hypothetical protein